MTITDVDDEVRELLGPSTFKPEALDQDGKKFAYDLEPARRKMRFLSDEVTRLREALAFYAEPDNYQPEPRRVRPVVADAGEIARTVLEAADA